MELSENVIQFIWNFRLFNQHDLLTVAEQPVRIERTGTQNFNEGPDFLNAVVNIAGIRLVGHIEIDRCSSDWNKHRHHLNQKYNTVILHVVYEYDVPIYRQDGSCPETLVLKPLIHARTIDRYRSMTSPNSWIPCQSLIGSVDSFYVAHWLNRLLFERMIQKTESVFGLLDEFNEDWEQVAYLSFARSFGHSVNAHAFDLLARAVPLDLIRENRHHSLRMDALMFGQAGMLNQPPQQEYPLRLSEIYADLQKQYGLKPMSPNHWNFLRMRPANFPTLRIAQFSAFCQNFDQFFPPVFEIESLNLLSLHLKRLSLNEYWFEHYRFGERSARHHGAVGEAAAKTIFINSLCLLLFAYGRRYDDVGLMDQSFERMSGVRAEKNSITDRYQLMGLEVNSAVESQALKHLKTIYCESKRCLDCEIGLQIIKKNRNE